MTPFELPTLATFDDYQKEAYETRQWAGQFEIVYPVIGVSNEAGEALGKVKKYLRGDGPLDHDDLIAELGDVLWYIAAAASDMGIPLSELALRNLKKLKDRQDRGVLSGNGDHR